jgi:UDP-3-O-[3-hydroxymyristoyl] glucosamine N-acyltransferase
MKFTANQIAAILNGKIKGDGSVSVNRLSKIEKGEQGTISFLSNKKYTKYIYTTEASIVIVNESFIPEKEIKPTLILVADPYQAFTRLLEYYNKVKLDKKGKEKPNFISKSARIEKECYIGAFSYIGENAKIGKGVKLYPHVYVGDNVSIGDHTILFSGVKIYSETQIGKDCIIHSNAVIGSDGFGFAPTKEGVYKKIPQTGNVVIGNDVEVGASCTIDRATLGSTIIHDGVKLDNQIQVAHNVEIGENTVIASQTGIAGSAKIGKNCIIGGQVGVAGHIVIGNYVKIQAQSGVGKNLKDEAIVQGSPSFGYSEWNKSYVYFKNLPKTIVNIEKNIKQLQNGETENDQ